MQTSGVNDDYKYLDLNPSKSLDAIVAIAGHGRLYSVTYDDYTIPSSGGDLNTGNGFSSVRKYADFPKIGAAKLKGDYPEEGGFSIGDCEVTFQDKRTDAHATEREFTDLASRWAYLEGNETGTETTLDEDLTASETDITLASGTGLAEGDVVHIGRESILLGSKSGATFTGCTRGYRLTIAQPHLSGVTVYAYLPSLKGRRLLVYKGYQGLALGSWIPAWAGIIDGVNHGPAQLTVHAMSTTWELYGGRARNDLKVKKQNKIDTGLGQNLKKIVRLGEIDDDTNEKRVAVSGVGNVLDGDYEVTFKSDLTAPTGLGDGHYAIKGTDTWLGIINPLVNEYGNIVVAKVCKFSNTTYPSDPIDEGQELDLGWSNATFSDSAAPGGSHLDPILLILKFMTSTTSDDHWNGTYDVFATGIGLAIPSGLIDIASFTNIRDQNDYDTNLGVFFLFSKPEGAKDFFDADLCKPFGWYLACDNAGKIKLVRPRNPIKLYVSKANQDFAISTSQEPLKTRHYYMPAGVYTPTEFCADLQTGLNKVTPGGFTVSWNSGTGIITISVSTGNFTFSASDAWATAGHTTASADTSKAGSTAVGIFTDSTGGFQTIDANDLKDIQIVDTLPQRIAEVWYHCNYDWSAEEFTQIKVFTDAEVANLDGEVQPYEIEARGLMRAFSGRSVRIGGFPFLLPPSNSDQCNAPLADVSSSYGIDSSDSFVTLFTSHLFDRYRGQPIRFKAKLPWKYNRLEIGDNVSVTYAIDGVFADYEQDAGTLTSRIFEVISIKPDFANGHVEAEFMGHRAGG